MKELAFDKIKPGSKKIKPFLGICVNCFANVDLVWKNVSKQLRKTDYSNSERRSARCFSTTVTVSATGWREETLRPPGAHGRMLLSMLQI